MENAVEQQAADWFLLLHSDETLSQAQLESFLEWLKDPEAEQAYTRCETLWELSGQLADDASITAVSQSCETRHRNRSVIRWWNDISAPFRYGLQAACLLAVVILIDWGGMFDQPEKYEIYQTATGQQKTIVLADGSQLSLNTSSEIHVSYRKDMRRVVLESGEVLFDVAKDKHRPFSVIVGNGKVTALGTIFNIKKSSKNASVEVALLEGQVEVAAKLQGKTVSSSLQKQHLLRNEITSYTAFSIDDVKKITDAEKITQWKDGRLSFTNAALSDVIEQVNRYTIDKLIVADPSLKAQTLDAYFVIGDTHTLLAALKETLGIHWIYRPDGIFLYRDVPAG